MNKAPTRLADLAAILLFCTWLALPATLRAQHVNNDPCVQLKTTRSGPFVVERDTFFVDVDRAVFIVNTITYTDRSDIAFRIVDNQGRMHHGETFLPAPTCEPGPKGFDVEFAVGDPFVLETAEGEALVLDFDVHPSAPLSGRSRYFLANVGGTLRPLSKPLTIYGEFEELLPGSREGARRLHEGDLMLFREWTGYHSVIVPVRLRLEEGTDVPFELPPFAPAAAQESDLVALETKFYERDYWGDHQGGMIKLYLGATGNASKEVLVSPDSDVAFGHAYATPRLYEHAAVIYVGADVRRVEVNVDGETGFIEGDHETLDALGISIAG